MPSIAASAGDSPAAVDFRRDVEPLLRRSCGKCHGEQKQQGGVRFDLPAGALQPADSGNRPVVPGQPDKSELLRRVASVDAAEQMPPEGERLTAEQISLLRAWIEQGAKRPAGAATAASANSVRGEMVVTDEDRQHWSYRPLQATGLPTPANDSWPETPIDKFILAAQEAGGLAPNPPADRRTLIRRAYFDLVGLPPSPEEVAAFERDASPDAYERLVDRLLASPRHGERWGRHWLDLARYADSDGLETDRDRPTAYHYRDFVIRALNRDLSYQTFVRWQLAGDEFEPDNPLALAATGFLTGAPCENLMVPMEEEKLRLRYNELDDMAVTTVSAFLGLTLGCARCHDHKFDALPTRDYYRLQCAFTTTTRGDLLLTTRAKAKTYREAEAAWSSRLQAAEKERKAWLDEHQRPHTAALRAAKIDALSIGGQEKRLLKEETDSAEAKKLAKKHAKALQIADQDYRAVFSSAERRQWDDLQQRVRAVERTKPASPPQALGIADKQPEPEPTWLLARGDFYAKQEPLTLGFLSALSRGREAADYLAAARHQHQSGASTLQRRALAQWLTDVEHGAGPLLARVIVSRVWQHHFGEGLVRTSGDFGVRGERPTHPELLEWLARELVARDWQLKWLHRQVLTSAVYQQATAFDPARARLDPDNRLLWRRRPQRLEAEILRDAVLAVSGTLNLQSFGPAFKPPIPPAAIVARNTKSPYPKDARDTPATRRRSVYMFHKRVTQHPLMQAFDEPDAAVSCARRNITTVAPQALALLNDDFVRDRAADFADRLMHAEAASEERIERAFRLALLRPPSKTERAAAIAFFASQQQRHAARKKQAHTNDSQREALTDFCQTLLGTNEFLYVD